MNERYDVPCCGMCDDECDCESAEKCMAEWRARAERAEHALSATDPGSSDE